MATIHREAQVSTNELLKAVEQLPATELDHFVNEVLHLRARRVAPALPEEESRLLEHINRGMPEDSRRRYRELIERRQGETLTPQEHAELLRLTDEDETRNAERLRALARLAQLRQTTLTALMDDLGIRTPEYE